MSTKHIVSVFCSIAFISGTLGVSAIRASSQGAPCHVLLISLDTTRRDHCSAYGYEFDTTPNLRGFAEQGARFDLAYAPTSTTAPTHATLFTGLYPIAHHVRKNGMALSSKYVTLAEQLRDHGYQTAAFVSSFVLNAKFGLGQGFGIYDDTFKLADSTFKAAEWNGHRIKDGFDQRGNRTTEKAIDWLTEERAEDVPFFLFVHYFDPHYPYGPPAPFASRFTPSGDHPTELQKDICLYDGEIAFTDQEIGRLLKALEQEGLAEQTLVVITADHGEGLMQHGFMGHGVHIYEEAVRVPLLFRWPGQIVGGRVFTAPVELVDLAPTILELSGIGAGNGGFQGRNLAMSLRGKMKLDRDRPIFLHRRHFTGGTKDGIWAKGEKFSIRAGNWKYIDGPAENTKELFDLLNDPGEKTNVYAAYREKANDLSTQLQLWKQLRSRVQPGQEKGISEEDRIRLKSLGYVE